MYASTAVNNDTAGVCELSLIEVHKFKLNTILFVNFETKAELGSLLMDLFPNEQNFDLDKNFITA
jgi:hypothetical protein